MTTFLLIVLTGAGPVQLGPFDQKTCEETRAWIVREGKGRTESARCVPTSVPAKVTATK